MGKQRKVGDWVWLSSHAGFSGSSWRLKAEIQDEGDEPEQCFICNDPQCREWSNLWTEPDPQQHGERHLLCHVSECQMFDEQQVPQCTATHPDSHRQCTMSTIHTGAHVVEAYDERWVTKCLSRPCEYEEVTEKNGDRWMECVHCGDRVPVEVHS